MLIKWITCAVRDREAFDRAQRGWSVLRGVPGFVGQAGGWSRETADVAHIFGCWSGRTAYESFMRHGHDYVAAAQSDTFESIETLLFDGLLDIGAGFPAAATSPAAATAVLRFAHCNVHAERRHHFITAQERVWNPGMLANPGMDGGAFARRGATEFLVLSLWRSSTDHERYRTAHLHELLSRSGAGRDLAAITAGTVAVEPAWTVHATGPRRRPGVTPGTTESSIV